MPETLLVDKSARPKIILNDDGTLSFIGGTSVPVGGSPGLFADGTAPLPSIAFTSEPSLGLWRSSAGVATFQGALVVTGKITSNGALQSNANGIALFGSGNFSKLVPQAEAQLNLMNNAITAGIGLDYATDAILKIRTRAQTGDAALSASLYGSSAVSALTITTNTIAPTSLIHQLGAGLVKTITVPATMGATGFLLLLPTAAFTYDATGNILVPSGGGTAVINKLMILTWDGTKWTPSY